MWRHPEECLDLVSTFAKRRCGIMALKDGQQVRPSQRPAKRAMLIFGPLSAAVHRCFVISSMNSMQPALQSLVHLVVEAFISPDFANR